MRTRTIAIASALLASGVASATPERDGSEFRIPITTANSESKPKVTRLADGNFVVVWQARDLPHAYTVDIIAREFSPAGVAVGLPFRVNEFDPDESSFENTPDVAAKQSGGFVVAWTNYGEDDGDETGVFARQVDDAGNPTGTQFLVNVQTTGTQFLQSIASRQDDGFVITWVDAGYLGIGEHNVEVRGFDSAGASEFGPIAVPESTEFVPSVPEVAVLSDESFVVVWASRYGEDGDGTSVRARRFGSEGTPLGESFPINSYTTGDQTLPDVAALTDAGFVVVWSSATEDGQSNIVARQFNGNGTARGNETVVNDPTDRVRSVPVVATSEDGSSIVAWSSNDQDGQGSGVFARQVSSVGAPIGPEFQVNTYTTGNQGGPGRSRIDIAVLNQSQFVVVWESNGQDDYGAGVFGQRFCRLLTDPPVCGNTTCVGADSSVTASDALVTLNSAVGLRSCDLCRCDLNASGNITASDALLVLNYAVGLPVTPNCPPCA